MKIALILAHPSSASYGAALAKRCAEVLETAGADVVVRDLYAMDFDPRLTARELAGGGAQPEPDVVAERSLLRTVDGLLLVYPLWFNGPPAILKGYIDRVLSAGFGYQPTAHGADPLLIGKTLMSVTTSGAPDAWIERTGAINTLARHFDLHLSHMTGLRVAGHVNIGGVGKDLSPEFAERGFGLARRALLSALLEGGDEDASTEPHPKT
jgi:NAD(P)H dehydrogenase (quinone)